MTDETYEFLDDYLRRAGAECDASECHGTLVGAACAGVGNGLGPCLGQILADCDPADIYVAECRANLMQLFESCCAELVSDRLDFTPLLPGDDESMSVRAAALGRWCQGFLFGLSLGGFTDLSGQVPEVQEIIRDLAQITRAGIEEGEDDEENEQAYAELVEFVRVGVQLVFEELNPPVEQQEQEPTLH